MNFIKYFSRTLLRQTDCDIVNTSLIDIMSNDRTPDWHYVNGGIFVGWHSQLPVAVIVQCTAVSHGRLCRRNGFAQLLLFGSSRRLSLRLVEGFLLRPQLLLLTHKLQGEKNTPIIPQSEKKMPIIITQFLTAIRHNRGPVGKRSACSTGKNMSTFWFYITYSTHPHHIYCN